MHLRLKLLLAIELARYGLFHPPEASCLWGLPRAFGHNLIGPHFDAAVEHANILKPSRTQKKRAFVSASRRPRVNHDFFVPGQLAGALAQLVERNQDTVCNVFFLVLSRRADIEEHDVFALVKL
ncbi:MAG: hypothetical protein AMJ84_10075 [Acidithiobacillales bacterium SM23_46]|nr:MAG: hypothetical protein AMJ84_10075 [Acidithiobacillales bacterium SM23_46]